MRRESERRQSLPLRLSAVLLTSLLVVACSKPANDKPSAAQKAAPAGAQTREQQPAGQAATKPRELIKVRLSHYPVLIGAPMYVAAEKGFFAQEGLDVELIQVKSGVALPTSLLTKEAEFSHPTLPQMVSVKSQNKDLVYVWNMVNQVTVDLFLSNQALQKIGVSPSAPLEQRYKALKGLVFSGTSPGAPAVRFAYYFVQKGGLNPEKDVTFQAIGDPSAQAAALKNGQVDAIPTSPPVPALLEAQGLGKVFISANDVPEFKNYPYHGIAVTAEYLQAKPEVIKAFVRAIQKASAYLQQDKAGSVAVLKKWFPNISADVLNASYDYHKPIWTTDGSYSEPMVKRAIDFTVQNGLAKDPVPAGEGGIWTNKFIAR